MRFCWSGICLRIVHRILQTVGSRRSLAPIVIFEIDELLIIHICPRSVRWITGISSRIRRLKDAYGGVGCIRTSGVDVPGGVV